MVSEAIIVPSWSNAEPQTSSRVLCESNVWKRSCAPSYVSRNVWICRMDIFNTTSIYLLPLWIIRSGVLLLCSCLLFDKVAITYQQLPHVVKSPSTPTLLLWSTCVPVGENTSTQAVLKHNFEVLYVSISCFLFTSTPLYLRGKCCTFYSTTFI